MSRRFLLILFLAALALVFCAGLLETTPGYMDADYYYAGAQLIAEGQGQAEPYLWNYLNAPDALPAPSFSYWMPLASLVSAAGLCLFPGLGLWGARLPMLLLAALVPPLTAVLAYRLLRDPAKAKLAGVLALFPGFYLAYLPTTDVFPLEMVLGGLFFLVGFAPEEAHPGPLRWGARFLGLGVLAGLLHLARADGILWLGAALVVVVISRLRGGQWKTRWALFYCVLVLAGYCAVMFPWMQRNLNEWGKLLPPGGSRALWVSEYEQTMIYPAALLTPSSWLSAGWGTHLRARLDAAVVILQSAVAVQGGVLLFPFMLAGLWQLRRRSEIWLGAGMWALLAVVMAVVFPFAAANGTYFHSAAALQPLLGAAAPLGLECLMLKYAAWRKAPRPGQLVRFMGVVAVFTGVLLSGAVYVQRVVGDQPSEVAWNASGMHYRAVEAELIRLGAEPGAPVLVNNPPGYWLVSRRPALVIPYGDTGMLLAAARQYGARYLILEQTNPWQLADLYHERVRVSELRYLGSVAATRLYRVSLEEQ